MKHIAETVCKYQITVLDQLNPMNRKQQRTGGFKLVKTPQMKTKAYPYAHKREKDTF